MKLIKLFAPLIVMTSSLGACGDSSVSKQDVLDYLLSDLEESGYMPEGISEEDIGELYICYVDGIKAKSGDSYGEILADIKSEKDSKYVGMVTDFQAPCIADSRKALEFYMNLYPMASPGKPVDFSDVGNYHREAAVLWLEDWLWANTPATDEIPLGGTGRSGETLYCMADYIAENSGDSHRDILIDLMNTFMQDIGAELKRPKYESLFEPAELSCLDY